MLEALYHSDAYQCDRGINPPGWLFDAMCWKSFWVPPLFKSTIAAVRRPPSLKAASGGHKCPGVDLLDRETHILASPFYSLEQDVEGDTRNLMALTGRARARGNLLGYDC